MSDTNSTQPATVKKFEWRGILIVAGLLLLIGGCSAVFASLPPSYSGMSCAELRVEALKNAGPYATEPFDVQKARDINEARANNGC